MKEMFFDIIVLIHIMIWIFIMLAFLKEDMARLNLYYVVPAVYLLHILPFHILISIKRYLKPKQWKIDDSNIRSSLIIPELFTNLRNSLDNYCTFNPISTQGMMIFGLITSAFRLYPPSYLLNK